MGTRSAPLGPASHGHGSGKPHPQPPLSSCFQPWGSPMGLLDAHQHPERAGESAAPWAVVAGLREKSVPPAAWAASSERVTGGFSEGSSRKERQALEAWLAGSRIFVLTLPALSPCSGTLAPWYRGCSRVMVAGKQAPFRLLFQEIQAKTEDVKQLSKQTHSCVCMCLCRIFSYPSSSGFRHRYMDAFSPSQPPRS